MLLIGIGHKARQGKDTVAGYLKEILKDDARIYSFAHELKVYCRDHHDILVNRWHHINTGMAMPDPKDDPIYGHTAILQMVGADERKLDEYHWVRKVEDKMLVESPQVAIITDVRYQNESEWVKRNDGYMVDVIRTQLNGDRWVDSGRDPKHESEIALDNFDFDFAIRCHDGDLSALRYKTLGTLNAIIKCEKEKTSALSAEVGHCVK